MVELLIDTKKLMETLSSIFEKDERGRYLGEVALVPLTNLSQIQIFYSTIHYLMKMHHVI